MAHGSPLDTSLVTSNRCLWSVLLISLASVANHNYFTAQQRPVLHDRRRDFWFPTFVFPFYLLYVNFCCLISCTVILACHDLSQHYDLLWHIMERHDFFRIEQEVHTPGTDQKNSACSLLPHSQSQKCKSQRPNGRMGLINPRGHPQIESRGSSSS